MDDYKRMYTFLFNEITDTIHRLTEAQQKSEEMFIRSGDTSIHILSNDEKEPK